PLDDVSPGIAPPPPNNFDGTSVYAVHQILDSKRRGGILHYLEDWEGYGPEEQSWVPAKDILDKGLLADNHRQFPDRPARCPRGHPRSVSSSGCVLVVSVPVAVPPDLPDPLLAGAAMPLDLLDPLLTGPPGRATECCSRAPGRAQSQDTSQLVSGVEEATPHVPMPHARPVPMPHAGPIHRVVPHDSPVPKTAATGGLPEMLRTLLVTPCSLPVTPTTSQSHVTPLLPEAAALAPITAPVSAHCLLLFPQLLFCLLLFLVLSMLLSIPPYLFVTMLKPVTLPCGISIPLPVPVPISMPVVCFPPVPVPDQVSVPISSPSHISSFIPFPHLAPVPPLAPTPVPVHGLSQVSYMPLVLSQTLPMAVPQDLILIIILHSVPSIGDTPLSVPVSGIEDVSLQDPVSGIENVTLSVPVSSIEDAPSHILVVTQAVLLSVFDANQTIAFPTSILEATVHKLGSDNGFAMLCSPDGLPNCLPECLFPAQYTNSIEEGTTPSPVPSMEDIAKSLDHCVEDATLLAVPWVEDVGRPSIPSKSNAALPPHNIGGFTVQSSSWCQEILPLKSFVHGVENATLFPMFSTKGAILSPISRAVKVALPYAPGRTNVPLDQLDPQPLATTVVQSRIHNCVGSCKYLNLRWLLFALQPALPSALRPVPASMLKSGPPNRPIPVITPQGSPLPLMAASVGPPVMLRTLAPPTAGQQLLRPHCWPPRPQ
ncbi:hypothetical protein P4O66_013365, partial [Electrophorus voltai]